MFAAMTNADLLAEIAAFLAAEGVAMTESTFGRRAVNDGKLVDRLRDGGSVTLATAEKVRAYIRANTPPPKATSENPSDSVTGAAEVPASQRHPQRNAA